MPGIWVLLADLPKNAPAKALLAHIITEQTSVPQKWIVQTLHMGSAPYVSKLAKEMNQAMPRNKEWGDVKQRIIRFITWSPFSAFSYYSFKLSFFSIRRQGWKNLVENIFRSKCLLYQITPPPFLPLSDLNNNVRRDTTKKANS